MYVRTARLGNGQVSGNGEKANDKECYGKVWRTLPHPFQLAPSPSLPVVVICPIDHRGPSQAHHRRSRPHREWNFFNHLPPSQPESYTQTEWESFSRKRVYTNPFSSCQTFVKKIMRRLLETDRLPPFPRALFLWTESLANQGHRPAGHSREGFMSAGQSQNKYIAPLHFVSKKILRSRSNCL